MAQNSGGKGPDDYLLKPIVGGRWTLVKFRWGRNFTGDVSVAERDKDAMERIFPIQQICVPDMAARYYNMKKRGKVPTMGASEFLAKYEEVDDD